jgi:eukaryotic translation initiation factor 2C
MMIGADVTHPPGVRAGESLHPSIAVTISGRTGDNVQFLPAIRLQEGRAEIISDLQDMMTAQFKEFEANTKAPPAKILFFRDGVSEGQYAAVCK